MYSDKGMVVGLKKYAYLVGAAAKNVGKTAITSLKGAVSKISDVVSGKINMSPTIRPVLDLTDIQSGEKQLASLLDKNQGLSVSSVTNKAAAISQNAKNENTNTSATKGQSTNGASLSFVQNNYSPTALSRLEIYRQTKNQFSAMKGLVDA